MAREMARETGSDTITNAKKNDITDRRIGIKS
jgi:hypothetical protein